MTSAPGVHRRYFHPGTAALAASSAGAALTVAIGLLNLVRGLDTGLVIPIVLVSYLAGWFSARLRGSLWLPLVLIGAAGILFQIIFAGQLAGRLWTLAWALARTPTDLSAWMHGDFSAWQPAALAWADWIQNWNVLLLRIAGWAASVRQGKAIFDPLIPNLTWGWVLWGVSAWAGCALRRGCSAFVVLLPAILLLAGGYGFVHQDPALLAVLLGTLLLMSVLSAQVRREQGWTARGLDYSTEIRSDLAVVTIPLFILVMGAAILIPSISWGTLFQSPATSNPSPPGSAQSMINSFGLQLPTRVPTVLDPYWAPGLPRSHLIGSGPELSQQVALTARLLSPGPNNPSTQEPAPRYYWRAFTYDRYIGSGWLTSAIATRRYPANSRLASSVPPEGSTTRFAIQESTALRGILFYSGSLVTVDRGISVQSRSGEDAFAGFLDRPEYQIEVEHPTFAAGELRQAGVDYPDWVKQRYLQLPDTLPSRVISLARALTATSANPYDRAKAIETYLHSIPYTLDLPAPPADRDVVDYFLFDQRKGYCDDFASAMVVLARVAGIPARLVVGYAPGQYDPVQHTLTMKESNAHSWAEVYFPRYGWVEFEPTPGIAPGTVDALGQRNPAFPPPVSSPSSGNRILLNPSGEKIPGWLIVLLPLAAGTFLFVIAMIRDWRLQRLAPRTGLEWIYRRLRKIDSDPNPPPGLTPNELGSLLAGRMGSLAGKRWIGRLFAPAVRETLTLIELYVREAYSGRPVTRTDFRQAVAGWRKLRLRIWVASRISFLNK